MKNGPKEGLRSEHDHEVKFGFVKSPKFLPAELELEDFT